MTGMWFQLKKYIRKKNSRCVSSGRKKKAKSINKHKENGTENQNRQDGLANL